MRKLILFLLISPCFAQLWNGILNPVGSSPCSGGLPTACAIDWTTAGVPGGIPSLFWTQSGSTILATTCNNGASDCTSTIQTALNSCTSISPNHFVLVDVGVFRINTHLTIPNNCELRGKGPANTQLNIFGTDASSIYFGNSLDGVNVPWSGGNSTTFTGGSAGATSITVASATGIVNGSLLMLTQPDLPYMTQIGHGGNCNFCNSETANDHNSGQIVRVTAGGGTTTLTIDPPLYIGYANPSYVFLFTVPVGTNSGLANLKVSQNQTHANANNATISMQGTYGVWLYRVESDFADNAHVFLQYSLHDEIRDSFTHDAFQHGPGSNDQQINVAYKTTASLIINNIVWRQHAGIMVQRGAIGNVIAYNYAVSNYDSGSTMFQEPGIDTHGTHPMLNLYEGNITNLFIWDDFWGSSSFHTLFRNYAQGSNSYLLPRDARGALNGSPIFQDNGNDFAIDLNDLNLSYNLIGNITGSAHTQGIGYAGVKSSPASGFSNNVCARYGYDGSDNIVALNLTSVSMSGTTATYTGTILGGGSNGFAGLTVTISGFAASSGANNGTFAVTSSTATTLVLTNASGVNETHSGAVNLVTPTTFIHGQYDCSNDTFTWDPGHANHTLPASFFLSSKPGWFGSIPFPPIGPDINSGGSGSLKYVNSIPAQVCFNKATSNGTTNTGSFDPAGCYPTTSSISSVILIGSTTVRGSVTLGSSASGVTLQSITVSPSNPTGAVGSPITFSALGAYSDGSTGDVTTQAAWTSGTPSVATNVTNVFTCIGQGTSQVKAQIVNISGTTTLSCQVIQVSPSGTLTAFQNVAFTQQFTATGGTPPYTFVSADLPAWLSLTSGGLLSGTSTNLGVFNFHITATDNAGHSSGSISITVDVIVATGEDNRYCNSDGTTNFSPTNDGPAALPINCVYTAIAATPSPGTVRFVCPTNQKQSNGTTPVPGCNPSASPPYYNTIQSALNAAQCGDWVQIYPNNWTTGPTNFQNAYDETLLLPATSCFGDVRGWITVSTLNVGQLPAAGTRITPSWVKQNTITGLPAYAQGPGGWQLPMIRCVPSGPNCYALYSPQASAGASGWRFIGLEFTMPHGREPQCPNNFNGTPQCSPGFTNPLVAIGCAAFEVSNCGVTGATHIILDRVIIHGCDDKNDLTCYDQTREGLQLEGGQYDALIDSFIYGIRTMAGIGPSVESHGVGGGNNQNTGDDGPFKVVNNFISASSIDAFWGGAKGGPANVFDYEFRRNHLFKPLTWKINNPAFTQYGGTIQDAWVSKTGSGYSPGAGCAITAPTGPNPVQAACTVTVVAGQVVDVQITNGGSGYIAHGKFTVAGGDGKASIFPLDGILNVKNCFEFKNGKRILVEGIHCENVWKGQADQDAFAALLTPRTANGNCLTCTVQDTTIRYSFFQNMNRAFQIGVEVDTGGNCAIPCQSLGVKRVSFHDLGFSGMTQNYWVSGTGQTDGFGGGCFHFQNAQDQSHTINDVVINHITCLSTVPTGGTSQSLSAGFSINSNCVNGVSILPGVTFENSIMAGGVKSTGVNTKGCYSCNNGSCGSSVTNLSAMLISDHLLPTGGGNYTTNQVMKGIVDTPGSCTTAPTSCAFTDSGGSSSSCGLKTAPDPANAGRFIVSAVWPISVGLGFTSNPSVTFSGQAGCATTPVAHGLVAGSGIAQTKAWCFDHNGLPLSAYLGEVSMMPYPTQQGDATNNTCSSHGGGGNVTVNTWTDAKFVNLPLDANGAEIPTGDLHVQLTSPFHATANDGLDMGANMDLVLGKSDGSAPSQYTGCTISNGVTVCPP